jgi:uncharacterized protein YjbI with pentapeptide repeats/SAM-dependent methyltransferase
MTELDVVDALRTGAVARFAGSSLIDANLPSADLRGVELSHVDLRMANLRAADLSGATLDHVDLAGADLSGGVLRRCRIEFSDLSHAVLAGADLMGATLRDCRCDAAVFVEAQLRDATLIGSRFDGANFDGALMVGMRSIDSSYRHARLTTARQFALVREVIAAVLAESAGDDPARISLAAMVASLRGWCWDTWAREQRTLVPHVWAWAAEVLRGCRESGCWTELLAAVGNTLPLPEEARSLIVPADQFAMLRMGNRTYALRRPLGPVVLAPSAILGQQLAATTRGSVVDLVVVPAPQAEIEAAYAVGPDVEILAAPDPPDVLAAECWATVDLAAIDREEACLTGELTALAAALPAGAMVIDPSCSSGAALATVAAARPDVRLYGSDRSPEMVAAARARLPSHAQLAVADARYGIGVRADMCILRCAAHTIVSAADADAILDRCVKQLRPGGVLVMYSVLPLYHDAAALAAFQLQVLHTTVRHDEHGVHPFYVAVRT